MVARPPPLPLHWVDIDEVHCFKYSDAQAFQRRQLHGKHSHQDRNNDRSNGQDEEDQVYQHQVKYQVHAVQVPNGPTLLYG